MRHFVIAAAGILTAALLFAAPARSQSASPDALAAAKELVIASKAAEGFKSVLPLIVQQMKPSIVKGKAAVEKDFDAVTPPLLEAATQQMGKFVDEIAAVYAANFSADELRQVTAFYQTPAGQKFLEKMPVIAQESMMTGQKLGQQITQDLETRIKEELRKRGHKV